MICIDKYKGSQCPMLMKFHVQFAISANYVYWPNINNVFYTCQNGQLHLYMYDTIQHYSRSGHHQSAAADQSIRTPSTRVKLPHNVDMIMPLAQKHKTC